MYKVLIVDDEYYSRRGLIKIIPWKDMNCEIIGEAENGIEALEIIKDKKPDIVVGDINMAGIDGLELEEKAPEFFNAKFIIITGYDDFNYAKRAVKVNAVDFIKKPINIQEFMEAVEKTIKIISKEKVYDGAIKEKQYLQVMRGELTFNEVYRNAGDGKAVRVVVINNDSYSINTKNNEEWKNREIIQLIRELSKTSFPKDAVVTTPHSNRMALVLDKYVNYDYKEIIDMINDRNLGDITISISKIDNEVNINGLYKSCKEMIEENCLWGVNRIITEKYHKKHEIDKKIIKGYIKDIIININSNNRGLAQENVKKLLKYLIEGCAKRKDLNQVGHEICVSVNEELNKKGKEIKYEEDIEKIRDVRELKIYLIEFVNNAID